MRSLILFNAFLAICSLPIVLSGCCDCFTSEVNLPQSRFTIFSPARGSHWHINQVLIVDIYVTPATIDCIAPVPKRISLALYTHFPNGSAVFLLHIIAGEVDWNFNGFQFRISRDLNNRIIAQSQRRGFLLNTVFAAPFSIRGFAYDETRTDPYDKPRTSSVASSSKFRISNQLNPTPYDGTLSRELETRRIDRSFDNFLVPLPLVQIIKHVTIMTVGPEDNVKLFLALGSALISSRPGLKCRIATHESFRNLVLMNGFEFSPLSGDSKGLVASMRKRGSVLNKLFTARKVVKHFLESSQRHFEEGFTATEGTDALIGTSTSAAVRHIAEARGIPFLYVMTSQRTDGTNTPWPKVGEISSGHSFFDMPGTIGLKEAKRQFYNKIAVPSTSRSFAKIWRITHGLPAKAREIHAPIIAPSLFSLSPEQEASAQRVDRVFFTGFWHYNDSQATIQAFLDAPESSPLLAFTKDAERLVCVGIGSAEVPSRDFAVKLVEVTSRFPRIQFIFAERWLKIPAEVKTKLPPNILFWGESVPQDWIFSLPNLKAVVVDSEVGTVSNALRFGKPVIVRPFHSDQFLWSHRLQELGIGIVLEDITTKFMISALKNLLTPTYQIKAAEFAQELQTQHGVEHAVKRLWSVIESDNISFRPSNILHQYF